MLKSVSTFQKRTLCLNVALEYTSMVNMCTQFNISDNAGAIAKTRNNK